MKVQVRETQPRRLLNPGSGYLTGYTHTLNPYTGCTYGCSYCYVRRMPVALFRDAPWGAWVDVKQDAARLLRKELRQAKKKGPVTIFLSSSTDPYQPAEATSRTTRAMLEVLAEEDVDFLFVQTRSPLVVRDADLLAALGDRVRVSVTVETDRDDMRRAFTPAAPPIRARLRALRTLAERGIPTQATIAPLLPCTERFAPMLAEIVDKVCIDDYFMGDGSHGARTERLGVRAIYERLGLTEWYDRDAYLRVLAQLREHFPPHAIGVSQAGFLPLQLLENGLR